MRGRWLVGYSPTAVAPLTQSDGLLQAYDDGIAVSAGTDGAGYVSVKDSATPSNDLSNAALQTYITNGTTSPKLCRQSDGTYKFSPHNLCEHSDDLNSFQFKNAITESGGVMTASAGAGSHRAADTLTIVENEVFTVSAEFKAGTHNYGFMGFETAAADFGVVVDLNLGTISETDGSPATSSTSITALEDGWYRASITVSFTGATRSGDYIKFGLAEQSTGNTWDGNSNPSWTAAGTETVSIRNMQCNKGSTILDHRATSGTKVFGTPIEYDPDAAAWAIRSETTESNLFLGSDTLDSYIAGVRCTVGSGTWVEDLQANQYEVTDNASTTNTAYCGKATVTTITADTTHTWQAILEYTDTQWVLMRVQFLTGVGQLGNYFDIVNGVTGNTDTNCTTEIESLGNNRYLCTVHFTGSGGDTQCDFYIGLAEANGDDNYVHDGRGVKISHWDIKVGGTASSYVPTYNGVSVTRDQDELYWVFSDETTTYSQPFTTYVKAKRLNVHASGSGAIISLNSNSSNYLIQEVTRQRTVNAGAFQGFNYNHGDVGTGSVFKTTMVAATNDLQGTLNGTSGAQDTSATVTFAADELALANLTGGATSNYDGYVYIYEALVVPERLSQAAQEELSTL